ncbi:HupE/UreJ family protein [Paenibacillus montanisoli]|uniref:HupE/UreJ family protein n=1 Tax=Paenibacillus montanisoli TaxID=2081970 RepID=A0A328TZ07_9BACL|nr:HupE/UreJ family protein [Paenibacillus montanisoli]RAP75757.1 hypothetical protein DL346_09920 [Paenibacillus montanisoli]
MVRKWFRFILAAVLLSVIALPGSRVFAHTDNSEGFSQITAAPGELRYELMLDYYELGRVVMLDASPGAPASELHRLLELHKQEVGGYIGNHLKVYIEGEAVDAELDELKVISKLGRYYASLSLRFPNASNSKGVQVDYNIFFDDNDSMHRNIAAFEFDGKEGQFVFNSSDRELGLGHTWFVGQALRFIKLGFHHIMIGLDHILFVIALLLTATSFRSLIKIATIFTLAHSVTLGLTAFHVLNVPAEVIEPLIALSIAYVAVEAFFLSGSKIRPFVVFGFGLVHGIGFAGALEMTGAVSTSSLLSLAAFNIGVELGQLLVISLLFPVLIYIRKFQ